MRILFIGCVDFSHSALERVLELPDAEVCGVVTLRESTFNSDFRSLEDLAKRAGVPCLFWEAGAPMVDQIAVLKPEVIYCFGWSKLLRPDVLRIPHLGAIGYHPAALPRNRGRHPIIWALALGLEETASTFLFLDEGADSGDLLSQRQVPIAPNDDAGSLYRKLTCVALEQIAEFTPELARCTFRRTPQDMRAATSWRKRAHEDGRIDWRMSASSIHNLVRALARPYPGAHCIYEGNEVRVWKAIPDPGKQAPWHEPGKVLHVERGEVVVKCGEGAVRLLTHEFAQLPAEGSYL